MILTHSMSRRDSLVQVKASSKKQIQKLLIIQVLVIKTAKDKGDYQQVPRAAAVAVPVHYLN